MIRYAIYDTGERVCCIAPHVARSFMGIEAIIGFWDTLAARQ